MEDGDDDEAQDAPPMLRQMPSFTRQPPPQFVRDGTFTLVQQLYGWLKAVNIDTSRWGQGRAKTPAVLMQELEERESTLFLENGVAYRNLTVVKVRRNCKRMLASL